MGRCGFRTPFPRGGTVQHGALDLGSSLRLDVGRRAPWAGAVSLWPLVSIDGLWTWAPGPSWCGPRTLCARRFFGAGRGRCRQRAAAQLGRARWASRSCVVGLVSLRRAAVVGRLGRPRVVNTSSSTARPWSTSRPHCLRKVGVQNAVWRPRGSLRRQPCARRASWRSIRAAAAVHGAVRTRPDAASFVAGSGPRRAPRLPRSSSRRHAPRLVPPSLAPSVVAAPAQAPHRARREPAPRIVGHDARALARSLRPAFGRARRNEYGQRRRRTLEPAPDVRTMRSQRVRCPVSRQTDWLRTAGRRPGRRRARRPLRSGARSAGDKYHRRRPRRRELRDGAGAASRRDEVG